LRALRIARFGGDGRGSLVLGFGTENASNALEVGFTRFPRFKLYSGKFNEFKEMRLIKINFTPLFSSSYRNVKIIYTYNIRLLAKWKTPQKTDFD
jgi:hypothetical protein